MSYLAQPTSKTDYGVVKVGNNISVSVDGIISLAQDLSPGANVIFNSGSFTTLTANGAAVVTSVTPSSGAGIGLSAVTTNGYAAAFTVTNTGVVSVAANDGIAVSGSTGNVSITNTGVVRLTGSPGLSVSNTSGNVALTNTGVVSLTAGTGISLSGSTGNVVVSTTGTSFINVVGVTSNYTATLTDEYIGVFSGNAVTITLPTGIDGRVYIIKDEYGQNSGKITVQPQANVLIDGKNNYIISVPYQSIQTVYRAGKWWII